jgi:DNA helicase-2/ATP-dependent DNA helicase PcrA
VGAIDAFDKLNPRQREAACAGNAPLLIVAGAGTGKTNTLAHRVAHLVLQGCPPERLLLLTLTRRAALEMTRRASRIVAQVKKEVRLPWSGTFHSVANRLIRLNCKRLGLTESFSVLDRGDAADLMDVARHERGLSKAEKRFPRKDTCLAIYSHRVNTQRPLAETLALMYPWCAEWEAELTGLFRNYVERKLSNQSLDYDDLLLYWHAMMQDEALAAEIGARFDHVLVDEYQDTNVLQAEILQRLKPSGHGLTVVGDDAQAIYSFRAATVENIRGFEKQFGAATVALEENYRSTQQVLDSANALIGKSLYSKKKAGAKPRYVTVADDEGQATYVVTRVLEARERGVLLRQPGGAVPRLAPLRPARARAGEAQHPVREVRRPQVPRGRARQGPARGAALGRTTRRTASPRSGRCSCCPASDRRGRRASSRASRPRVLGRR